MSQIFLSYAQDDNRTADDDQTGWISYLYGALLNELVQRGVLDIQLWRDEREIRPYEQIADVIEDGLAKSDILISILSPVYIQRDWCMRELNRFGEILGGDDRKQRGRIFKIIKRPIEPAPEPVQLLGQLPYEFFVINLENDREIPFYNPGRGIPDARYWDVIEALAADLTVRLTVLQGTSTDVEPAMPQSENPIALLTYATEDMADVSRQVRGELRSLGVRVVPEADQTPPLAAPALENELNGHLQDAAFSVHLVGKTPGFIPEGTDLPISVFQLEAARSAGVRRIIWMPQTTKRDKVAAKIVSDLRSGATMADDDELIEEGFDRLKGFLKLLLPESADSSGTQASADVLLRVQNMTEEEREALRKALGPD